MFAVGWLVATFGFALYVANFADYGATYGALAGVIVLMLWFYVTALVLVAAGELVALLTKRFEPGLIDERREAIRLDRAAASAAASITDKVDETVRPERAHGARRIVGTRDREPPTDGTPGALSDEPSGRTGARRCRRPDRCHGRDPDVAHPETLTRAGS